MVLSSPLNGAALNVRRTLPGTLNEGVEASPGTAFEPKRAHLLPALPLLKTQPVRSVFSALDVVGLQTLSLPPLPVLVSKVSLRSTAPGTMSMFMPGRPRKRNETVLSAFCVILSRALPMSFEPSKLALKSVAAGAEVSVRLSFFTTPFSIYGYVS